jgi:hypothetical protein
MKMLFALNPLMLPSLFSAVLMVSCGDSRPTSIRSNPNNFNFAGGVEDYQIGPTWEKVAVKPETIDQYTPAIQRAIKATAFVSLGFGGATAFALGEQDGELLMATNHHVLNGEGKCEAATISFKILGISDLSCSGLIGTWKDVDYTLFKLAGYTPEQKAAILDVARDFNFEKPLVKGQKLATVGFGFAGNMGQANVMVTLDDDCKVYSNDEESRFMADPDELNPGPYKSWGFAMGCDVSHGDSGSAMIDRETGDVIGLLFTGKIPKVESVRSREWLDDVYARSDEAMWKELNFAVPAKKIKEITGIDLLD